MATALLESARHLLRAPVLADERFDRVLAGRDYVTRWFFASALSQLMRLLGSTASQSAIAFQLPADGGFVNLDPGRNLRLTMSRFQKRMNLASLFPDMLCAGSHLCSFAWIGTRNSDTTAAYLLFQPLILHL